MTVINTNTASINAQFNLNKVNKEMEKAMEQLSSGKRINSAGDDAAGIGIAARMESQVRGLNQAMRNAADGQSLVDTAEGAMDEISNMLQRMRELALQAANDTNSSDDREALNLEIEALTAEIDRVVSTTSFNGQNILDGSADLSFQIGSEAGQDLQVSINSMGSASLGSLTGAVSTTAVLSSAHQGVAAEITEVKIAFDGTDSYSFNLNVTTDAGDDVLAISADLRNGSAVDIAGAINALAADNDIDSYVEAVASGNVVTITNSYGAAISVDTFAAEGAGSATYTTVNGGDASDSVVNLGGTVTNTSTVFNTSGADAYVAAADATDGTAATFVEELSGFTSMTAWVDADFGTNADHIEVDFGDYSVSVALGDADSIGNFAAAINQEQNAYTFSALVEDDGAGGLTYSLKATANNVGEVDLVNNTPTISVVDEDGVAVTDGVFGTDQAMDETIVNGTDATDAVAESGGSKLYLDLQGADTYSFTLNTVDIEFTYTGSSGNRDQIAAAIETAMNGGTGDTYDVVNQNGRIEITNQDATDLALSAFTSEGSGTVLASTDVGQADAEGTAELLDDSVTAVTASTVAAGTADATDIDIEFTADDTYSFKVSDGVRTATVDATAVDVSGTDATDMEAAINYALERAGLDTSISVAHVGGVITLTQAAGREISLTEFVSDGSGSAIVTSGSDDTTGAGRYLNDGTGANGPTISTIAVDTASKASDAIAVIDRALQDIASERASLGAVSNRLDHTISNLGNVVINTEASQSRIEDADFAKVTGDLTKSQIMSQAATAMLAQANASKQGVLSLLQG
ncbi:flagellin [Planktomarina temperata]|nr:flagellin [Planktomarina temperata]